ncbi:MAG: NUDIX domain-containing protein [Gemmatimonadaceae bacterium]|nr:NUDIX domain-containing protein [Gemmatimonadaceae bacterium]
MPTRVIAAVIERNGLFLVCRRPDDKRHGGLWEFPGGKLEQGESAFEGTRRELEEELGVQVKEVAPTLFSVADPGSDVVIEFTPTTIRGLPQALEHSEIRWTDLAALQLLDLAPSDRRFVEYLTPLRVAAKE